MIKNPSIFLLIYSFTLLCNTAIAAENSNTKPRWYTEQQVILGQGLYKTYCATCHQPDASGTKEWKKADSNGHYPPPPLDGSAHTWHHPLEILRRTVQDGGLKLGGVMPGFEAILKKAEINAIIAWVQSLWSREIYAIWSEREREYNAQKQ